MASLGHHIKTNLIPRISRQNAPVTSSLNEDIQPGLSLFSTWCIFDYADLVVAIWVGTSVEPHRPEGVLVVEDPAKRFCHCICRIFVRTDVLKDNVSHLFPLLNCKPLNVNMPCTRCWTILIHHHDRGHIDKVLIYQSMMYISLYHHCDSIL